MTGEKGEALKRRLRTGTVLTYDEAGHVSARLTYAQGELDGAVELGPGALRGAARQHVRSQVGETARVGQIGIVAFPNFAHWFNRLSVLRGRMPVTKRLPYQWYDTPNIRVGTFADFADLARKNDLQVLDAFGLQHGQEVRLWPNLMAGTAVFKLQRS